MEFFYILVGCWSIYTVVHFFVVQHKKNWKDRTTYERFMTVASMVVIVLWMLASAE